ncbi:MAG: hypothetical protein QM755_14025 [Luteolibacter sp.]
MKPISKRALRDTAFDSASYASAAGSLAPALLTYGLGWIQGWGGVLIYVISCLLSWVGLMITASLLSRHIPWFCARVQSRRLLVLAMGGCALGLVATPACGIALLSLLGKEWNFALRKDLLQLGAMAFSGAAYGSFMGAFAGLRLRFITGRW